MSRFSAWVPTVAMMLVSLISYIDRNTLALLAPTILKETHLTGEQYGFIISAFSVAYMIGNPLWGRLLDTAGLRRGMTAAVSFWTLASAAHAFAGGFWSFAVARAALGFGEGATFPGGLRTVVQTLRPSERSRGIAVAYSGGSLGAVVTPIIVTPIALRWGWRGAFWFTGFVGLLWLIAWLYIGRRVGPAPAAAARKSTRIPWSDPRIWSFMAAYAFGGLPLAFVLYNAAIYLSQSLGKSQGEIGAVLWIPPLGWEAGYFFWGWITDRYPKRFRALLGVLTALSLPMALTTSLPFYPLVLAELFFSMFIAAGFIIVTVAYATAIYSSNHAGLLAGLGAGSWSALVALVMPAFGRLFDLHRYDQAFLLATAFPLVGFGVWAMINRPGHAKS